MNRKKIIQVWIGLLVVVSLGLIGCSHNVEKSVETIEPYIAEINLNEYNTDGKLSIVEREMGCNVQYYDMDLILDTDEKVLYGSIIISLINDTESDLNEICIRNYAASILKEFGKGKSIINNIIDMRTDENLSIEVKEDESVVYVDLSQQPLKSGDSISVKVDFKTDIPNQKERFGYVQEKDNLIFQLSFCFPALAMYENGQWNESPYIDGAESAYSKVTNYNIVLNTSEEFMVVSSGEEETQNGITTIKAKDMRDVAIVASNYMKVDTESVDGIHINLYSLDYDFEEEYNYFSMESAKDSVQLYTKLIGKYPYKELDIVQTFMPSAMEYPALIMIGYPDVQSINDVAEGTSYVSLCSRISHEVAHQWFYAAIGNDQYNEAWLDEGFSEYCADILYTQSGCRSYIEAVRKDARSYDVFYDKTKEEFDHRMDDWIEQVLGDSIIINKAFDEYNLEKDEYSQYVYDGGACFLYELRKTMGDDAFFRLLQEYYTVYSMKEVHTKDFIDAIRIFDDSKEVEEIIEKYFDTNLF